jgi:hypothetical protein
LLEPGNIGRVPRERGVYQLYHRDQLVYTRKAQNLSSRLTQHRRKIAGRNNVALAEMKFKCLYMSANWINLAPETQLVALYTSQGTSIWNGGGFGPHDPGAGREERNDPPASFDQQFPIRADWQCGFVTAGEWSVLELLRAMKRQLPFLIRYQKPPADYEGVNVIVPNPGMTAAELLRLIAGALPAGWQATTFPSHMILYKRIRDFQYGTVIYPEPTV